MLVLRIILIEALLPRDATQSAVIPQYVICLSVCLSDCPWVPRRSGISWSHKLKYFENNFTAEWLKVGLLALAHNDLNMGDLVQREYPKIRVELGWGQEHKKNLQYPWNGAI